MIILNFNENATGRRISVKASVGWLMLCPCLTFNQIFRCMVTWFTKLKHSENETNKNSEFWRSKYCTGFSSEGFGSFHLERG